MTSIMNMIFTYCSCCLNCGSFVVQEGGLCVGCTKICQSLVLDEDLQVSGLSLKALFHWRPGESDLLSKQILYLKGGGAGWVWRYYAKIFAKKIVGTITTSSPLYIVPAPPKRKGQKDHAYIWGEALAEALGGRLVPCLPRVSKRHQRFADIGERSSVEMKVLEKYSNNVDLSGGAHWIFVDDVVTTGATAQAAFQALGCPGNFQVWALAHRSLSCGASRDLLYRPHA